MSQQIREQIAQLEQQQAELKVRLEQAEREEKIAILNAKFAAQKQEHQELKATYESSYAEIFPQVLQAVADLRKLVQSQLVPAIAYKNFFESDKNSTYFDQTNCMNAEEYSRLDGLTNLFEQFDTELEAMHEKLRTF